MSISDLLIRVFPVASVCMPLLFSSSAYAQHDAFIDQIGFAVGKRNHSLNWYRLGIRKDLDRFFHGTKSGSMAGSMESSLNLVRADKGDIYALAMSPVFSYAFNVPNSPTRPYVEAGIGLSMVSDTDLNNRDLSTHLLFEDILGVGVRAKTYSLGLRYTHYSNAGLREPNNGMDIFVLTYMHSY